MSDVDPETVPDLSPEEARELLSGMYGWQIGLLSDGVPPYQNLAEAVGVRALRLAKIAGRTTILIPHAQPGSQIDRDDDREWSRRHGDFTVNHQAAVRLGAAINQLTSHAMPYLELGSLPKFYPHAEFSTLRGALEAIALARWLLEPDESAERVRRALCAKRSEGFYEAQALGLADFQDTTDFQAQLSRSLADAAAEVGESAPERLPSSTKMVDACPPLPAGEDIRTSVGFQWRVCSSYAHGFDWADWHHRAGEAQSTVPYVALAQAFVTACDALHLVWIERWLPLSTVEAVDPSADGFLPLWPVQEDEMHEGDAEGDHELEGEAGA
ncbi:hypothetical protein [uncultured Serinicoccus sp.]|uniref:hypothetical protein n=1 Tax=uncultured Serinicoccus sp. TaxID=735514 RepID=UPI00260F17FA|nr:hypothetical protein [uncultured Serinicoccus sp.]